jgi:hypothetical protein
VGVVAEVRGLRSYNTRYAKQVAENAVVSIQLRRFSRCALSVFLALA